MNGRGVESGGCMAGSVAWWEGCWSREATLTGSGAQQQRRQVVSECERFAVVAHDGGDYHGGYQLGALEHHLLTQRPRPCQRPTSTNGPCMPGTEGTHLERVLHVVHAMIGQPRGEEHQQGQPNIGHPDLPWGGGRL